MNDWQSIPGWFSDEDSKLYLAAVAAVQEPAHFVEIGSWQGRSAACMAGLIRTSEKLIRFDCVDTWRGSPYGAHPEMVSALEADGKTLSEEFERNLRKCGAWPYANPVKADSAEAAALYRDASLDFVFIDADHRREMVERDIRAWLPKIRPGGIIAGHDWTNPDVQAAVNGLLGAPQARAMVWWVRLPGAQDAPAARVEYPVRWGSGDRWRPWIAQGLRMACVDHAASERLIGESAFLEGAWDGKSPIHIAALDITEGGETRRVWYDFSDFRRSFPMGGPLFKVQAVQGEPVLPIGQGVGAAHEYLEMLTALRDLAAVPPQQNVAAVFSNTDKTGLRDRAVRTLKSRGLSGPIGLCRFNGLRSEPPEDIRASRLTARRHWIEQAISSMCVALPGVEGDWTWRHTEVLGIGRPLLTLQTDQTMPGNWRGCWAEAKRDLSDLGDRVSGLMADEAERERLGRLGRWYYETSLRPDRMVRRIIDESRGPWRTQ